MPTIVARRPILVAIVALTLIVVLLLGGRAAWRLAYRFAGPPPPPRQTDVSAIAGWMTVPYVARAYRVPPPELFGALAIEPEGHRTTTLDAIAAETGRPAGEVIETVRQTVRVWQESHPPPDRDGRGPDGPRPDGPRPDGPNPDSPGPGRPPG